MIAEVDGSFLDEYFHLLTNPAHIAFELTLMLIIDVLIIAIIWPKLKAYVIRRHDKEFHKNETH